MECCALQEQSLDLNMRTFPKELRDFRRMVEERGAALRRLGFEDLVAAGNLPIEHVMVRKRHATIGIIVEIDSEGALRVVVQGFMPSRLFPWWKNVALDGFYVRPNGIVEAMPEKEYYEFD